VVDRWQAAVSKEGRECELEGVTDNVVDRQIINTGGETSSNKED
jgi:hypothetical protein